MSKTPDQLLGHAEDNDGIEEYDNPLPDWWLGMFFFTIVFAIGYTAEYHFVTQRSQAAAYDTEMRLAEARWPKVEPNAALAFDDATIQAGREVFASTCASCHGAELQGGIGPNLKDAEWIHGSDAASVVTVINEGVAAKGMPAWGPILGPDKVSKVASFILSQQGDDAPAVAPKEAAAVDAVAEAAPLSGEALYAQNCAACHAADMTGGVGPSLVDAEWIHGSEIEQIRATIRDGVPAKGMVAWGPILGDEKIEVLAQFVHGQATERTH